MNLVLEVCFLFFFIKCIKYLYKTEFSPWLQDILEKKILEFFPPSLSHFGERINPLPWYHKDSIRIEKENWRPSGILIAHFHEHSSRINCIRVSADQSYFATASDDGTIKIWDTKRLYTNVINLSRLTYSHLGNFFFSFLPCFNEKY
jgi:phosphoinositide-3-kinase regulatory subunit 4